MQRGTLLDQSDSTEVFPFVGVEPLLLGMTKVAMLRELGRQDNEDPRAETGFERDEVYKYAEFGVSLDFTTDAFDRLSSIDLLTPRFHYRGNTLVGIREEELKDLVSAGILPSLELEDIDVAKETGMDLAPLRRYTCETLGLSFWVEAGVVDTCTMFSQYDPSGEIYMWPAVGED